MRFTLLNYSFTHIKMPPQSATKYINLVYHVTYMQERVPIAVGKELTTINARFLPL